MFLLLKFWEGVDYIIPQLPSGLRLGVVSPGSFSSPEEVSAHPRARQGPAQRSGLGQGGDSAIQMASRVSQKC